MDNNEDIIFWEAPEHEHREHSADWYWAVGIISVSLAVAFFIVGNMLLSIIIIVGIGTLLLHAKSTPKNVACTLSKKGVGVDSKLYPWETLESFWILRGDENEKHPAAPKILITSKKPLMPRIIVPLSLEIMEDAHQGLAHMLPEEQQYEPLPDRIMRKLGF